MLPTDLKRMANDKLHENTDLFFIERLIHGAIFHFLMKI